MADDSVAEGERSRWLQPAKDQAAQPSSNWAPYIPTKKSQERERRWVRSSKILCLPVVIVHQTPSVSLCPLLFWDLRVLVIAPSREQARVSRLSADCGWSIISKSPVHPPPQPQSPVRVSACFTPTNNSPLSPSAATSPGAAASATPRARSASSTMPAKSRKVTTLTEGTTWLAGNRAVVRRGQT